LLDNGSLGTFPQQRLDAVTDELFEVVVCLFFSSGTIKGGHVVDWFNRTGIVNQYPLLGNDSVNTFPWEPTRATIGHLLLDNGSVNTPKTRRDNRRRRFPWGPPRSYITGSSKGAVVERVVIENWSSSGDDSRRWLRRNGKKAIRLRKEVVSIAELRMLPARFSNAFDRFDILIAMIVKSSAFWDIRPCSPLKDNRRFEGTYHLHLQGRRISLTRN
jgi:hypothetical protein